MISEALEIVEVAEKKIRSLYDEEVAAIAPRAVAFSRKKPKKTVI